MNHKKYNDDDIALIKSGQMTIDDFAEKYKVSRATAYKAIYRSDARLVKKRIKIITPYGETICDSQTEVAQELKISPTMVGMILKGYDKCEIIKELNIKLEIID